MRKLAMLNRVIRVEELRIPPHNRLWALFGVNDGFWTGLQLDYDAARVKDERSAELARITPLELES